MNKKQYTQNERLSRLEQVVTKLYLQNEAVKMELSKIQKRFFIGRFRPDKRFFRFIKTYFNKLKTFLLKLFKND